MYRACFFVFAALVPLVGTAADGAINPFQNLLIVRVPSVVMVGEMPPLLPDDAHVFGYIAEFLHLGSGGDRELIQQLENTSSIDHLHDYQGGAIFAVKPELLGSDGASRVRDADGNYPFFVFRQLDHGWVLLGQMQGRGYEWSTQTRALVFNMSVQKRNGARTTVRYEVNSGSLANLNELAREERRPVKFVPDLRNSF